ncbi:MAG: hypothetical protein JWN27_2710 [Candidatus Eremiobacteraeota bacterium]|nr:hypothetical protein [Candidatus Eremiobacteraeota bacterium]
MKQPFLRPAALAALIGLAACSASQTAGSTGSVVPSTQTRQVQDGYGTPPRMDMSVALYDAPLPTHGDAHVYLAVAGMDVVGGGNAQQLVAYASPRNVDLLTLKQTAFSLAGTLPAGSYDAIRLLVSPAGSKVVLDGRVYPIVFNNRGRSGRQPAIVALDAPIAVAGAAGESISLDVDFNVLESISLRGGLAYVKPKLVVAGKSARMRGRVVNDAGAPVSQATIIAYDQNGTVVNTTITEADGSFTIHALRAGAYRILVANSYVTDSGDTISAEGSTKSSTPSVNVALAAGDDLDLGTLSD